MKKRQLRQQIESTYRSLVWQQTRYQAAKQTIKTKLNANNFLWLAPSTLSFIAGLFLLDMAILKKLSFYAARIKIVRVLERSALKWLSRI